MAQRRILTIRRVRNSIHRTAIIFLAGLFLWADATATEQEASVVDCDAGATALTTRLIHADGRESKVLAWFPRSAGTYPYIVFSHGAFSSPEFYDRLLRVWAGAGYVVVAVRHADSEQITGGERLPREYTWRTRREDVALLLSVPEKIRALVAERDITIAPLPPVVAGHSYGAFTAQVFAGARGRPAPAQPAAQEDGVDVAGVIAFSPPGPLEGIIEPDAWNQMDSPQLVVTGTADILPGFIDDWRLHRMAHDRSPVGGKWLLVAEGADHYFGNLIGRPEREAAPQSAQFAAATAASLDFLAEFHPGPARVVCSSARMNLTVVTEFERR